MLLDIIQKGTTDYSVTIRIVDSTDGTPETGVVFNTSGIDLWYRRPGGAHTSITEATQTEGGAHADGGFVHISDGYYRLDLPDAAVASGVDYVDIGGTVTGMVVIGGRVRLTGVDLDDAVRGGMTALPNAAADAAGGLPISDAGGLDLDALNTNVSDVLTDTGTTLPATLATIAGYIDTEVAAIKAVTDALPDSGALTSLATAAALATVDSNVDAILVDTGTTLETHLTDIKGATFSGATDSLEAIRDRGDAAWVTGAGGSAPTAADIRAEIDANSTQLAAIVADTNELQTDWANGGRLDLILDARASQTSMDTAQADLDIITGASGVVIADGSITDASFDTTAGDFHALGVVDQGTAQSATSTTLVLRSAAAFADDELIGAVILITGGSAGVGQVRTITDYVSSTDTATVDTWTTTPSGTITYKIFAASPAPATAPDVNVATIGGQTASATGTVDFDDLAEILTDTGTTLPATLSTIAGYIDTEVAAIKAVTDALPDSGALTSLATAAALATVDSNVDAILVDTGTTLETHLTDIKGATFSGATDSLEAIRNRGDAAWTTGAGGTPPQLLQNTTIATLASQTSFTLTDGSADDDAYNGAVVVVTDQSTATQKAVGSVQDYTGSSKTVTLSADPGVFTMAVGDTIDIIANNSSAPTAAQVRAEIDANSTQLAAIVADTNELQTDWANGGRLDLILDARASQASVDTVDSNVDAILVDTGTTLPATLSTIAGYIDTEVAAIKAVTDALPDAGALTSLATAAALATVDSNVDAILTDTGTTLPATLSTIAGYIDTEVAAIKAVTDALPDAGALTSLATAAALTTVDTVVDAIKAKTDSLTFTVAGQVDANMQYINDAQVTGDGNATPWDGA